MLRSNLEELRSDKESLRKEDRTVLSIWSEIKIIKEISGTNNCKTIGKIHTTYNI